MSIYEGVKDSTGINWINPVAIPAVQDVPAAVEDESVADTANMPDSLWTYDESGCNFWYYVDGFKKPPVEVHNYFSNKCYAEGITIKNDSSMRVGKYKAMLIKYENRARFWAKFYHDRKPVKGENTFTEDFNLSYTFDIKKLGWANIDRLYSNPKTELVSLIVNIDNQADFDLVYTSMVIEKMYLPGYQKKDNTYGFTHGDNEQTRLPVGEKATIIATAYKGEKAYVAIKTFNVATRQTLSLKLEETTLDDLKSQIKGTL